MAVATVESVLRMPHLAKMEVRPANSADPTANISRQEAVTMIGRLLEKGYAAPALTFRDSAQVAPWAESYVSTLSALGILTGDTDGRFLPASPMTRAQVATVLYKLL